MLREDVVAPALVLVVILGVWWVGARVIAEFWNPRDTVAAPRTEPPPATAPRPAGADATQHTRAPGTPGGDPLPNPRYSSPSAARSPEPVTRRRVRDRRERCVGRLAGRHGHDRGNRHD